MEGGTLITEPEDRDREGGIEDTAGEVGYTVTSLDDGDILGETSSASRVLGRDQTGCNTGDKSETIGE